MFFRGQNGYSIVWNFQNHTEIALVGSHGKLIIRINKNKVTQRESFGRSDFVGHTWTLPRTFLEYYLESDKLSLHTGEDIQLSFALQKVGVQF